MNNHKNYCQPICVLLKVKQFAFHNKTKTCKDMCGRLSVLIRKVPDLKSSYEKRIENEKQFVFHREFVWRNTVPGKDLERA